ncbi:MAG TPA: hypothetical protein VK993_15350 [Chthoniobacterales bacterium]|nr:hypothetical protein [Chthoniobacterales bacterium]
MIRRFNYTERQRILKSHVAIRFVAGQRMSFDAELKLDSLALPHEARVYVEAYFHGTLMRFDFGTIGSICPPAHRLLTRFPQPDLVSFRVKVVDSSKRRGLLLATGERMTASGERGGPSTRVSIIRVIATRLASEIWRLRFYEEGPVLELNDEISDVKEIARGDPAFSALVFPTIVRSVLDQILVKDKYDYDPDDDSWRSMWLRFALTVTRERPPKPEDEGEINTWIDDVVSRFSSRQKSVAHYKRALRAAEISI